MKTPNSTTQRTKTAFDSIEQEAYLQLWRTYDRLHEVESSVFEPHGVTAQQYNVLRVLQSIQPEYMTTTVLSSRLVSRAPDMTRLLDKLEAKGLLTRRRGLDNRRIVEVSLTTAGSKLIKQISADVRRCGHQQLGHLSPQKLKQLIAILQEARQPHEDHCSIDAWPGNRT